MSPVVTARRRSFDGLRVHGWSDGSVTGAMGYALPGVPLSKRPGVARLFLGNVELFDADELGALHEAAKWGANRGATMGDVRERAAARLRPRLTPQWRVTRTDARGRATERVWELPRLLLGLGHVVVFDRPTAAARYSVWHREQRHHPVAGTAEVLVSSGLAFRSLDELQRHLSTLREGCEVAA